MVTHHSLTGLTGRKAEGRPSASAAAGRVSYALLLQPPLPAAPRLASSAPLKQEDQKQTLMNAKLELEEVDAQPLLTCLRKQNA